MTRPDPPRDQPEAPANPGRTLHPWDEIPPALLKPAHAYAAQRDWPGYFAAVAGKGPRETLIEALRLWGDRPPGFAVDLAAGEGRDAAELVRRGWRVLAIDGHPQAIARMAARVDVPDWSRLRTVQAMMEDAPLPECDLLNASFALPFCLPHRFAELWERIVSAVRPGGWFCGQLFGDRDTWAALPDRSHQTREQAMEMLARFDIAQFNEEDKDGADAHHHPKHWHVYHVVARKR